MGALNRISLVWKALAVLVSVFALATIAVAALSVWRIDRNLTAQFEARGVAIADSFASSSVEVLLFRDVSSAQSMIDQYLELEDVAYVFVVNPKSEIVAHTFVPAIPAEARDLKVDKRARIRQQLFIEGIGDVIDVSSPILDGEVGHVHVGMDRKRIRTAIWSAVTHLLLLLGLIFFLSLGGTIVLIRRIVRPLEKLTDYANALATSGTSAANQLIAGAEIHTIAGRADEVGQLAQAFRFMIDQVSAQEQKLRKAHDDVEMRVHERTAALATANKALQTEIAEREQMENKQRETAAELAHTNQELEQFNRLMIGREQRIIELKREINALSEALGRPAPYDLAFAETEGNEP